MEGTGGAAAVPVDPQVQTAMDELKTLGGCCKDSDNVLEKINSTHENLSRQVPAEREQDIERQVQKLRAMYQRAKMLAEKETESCLQCLAKVDDLIFKKTVPATPLSRPPLAAPVTKTPNPQKVAERQAADAERREAAKKKAEAREKKLEAEDRLQEASKTNNVDIVRECLEGGADVNKAKGGWCALHFAASKNAPEVAQLLCEHGADVNSSSTKDGWTALIWACSMNNVQVAKILIDHKADVNQPGSKDGSTPLGWCAFKESVEVAELLLQANADVSACAQDNKANSALHWASTRNACGVARMLLKYGARVDLENKDGKTPLTIETAGAEVLKILKGEDPGVGADPARAAPCVNMPVTNSKPAHSSGVEGGAKSQQDASNVPSDAASATSAAAGQSEAANGGSGKALAQQSCTGGKLGSGGKGLASAPGSRDPGANDDEDEDDNAEQAPDSLASASGAEAEAGQAAAAAADDDDSSDSDDEDD